MRQRKTQQYEVLMKKANTFSSFFSAEDLQKRTTKVSLPTIYRFLKDMVKEGTLFSYQCERRTVYSAKKRSHCHFLCEDTGKVIHFDVDNLDFLKKHIPGEIESFQIEVKGRSKSL